VAGDRDAGSGADGRDREDRAAGRPADCHRASDSAGAVERLRLSGLPFNLARIAARRAYDRLRLRILATIINITPNGYREADARFLAGGILFKQSDTAEAVEWWRAMQPVDGDTYAGAARAVKSVVDKDGMLDTFELRRVLSTESARWAEINYKRMRQFGYACDSY
jgi:hypothetical protein